MESGRRESETETEPYAVALLPLAFSFLPQPWLGVLSRLLTQLLSALPLCVYAQFRRQSS